MMTIREYGVERGRRWVAKDGDVYVGAFDYTFLPANTGHLFARNRGAGYATAQISIGNIVIARTKLEGCQFQRDADKAARVWFRSVDARGKLHAAWLLGEHVLEGRQFYERIYTG